MKRTFLCLISLSLSVAPFIRGQNTDKETEEQLRRATEQANKMGVQMPDIKKLMEENAKEEGETKKEVATKSTGPAVLPKWAPAVPQFTAAGPATKKMIDGQEKVVITGTSPLSPEALCDEWDKFKSDKFSHERTGSDINHNVDLFVTFRNNQNGTEVRMEAERKAGAKITHVTLTSPVVNQPSLLDEEPAKNSDEKKDATDGAQPISTPGPAQP